MADSAQTTVEVRGVHKVYPMGGEEVRALNGVTFAIQRGAFWAVMGPSGSGKSTLLNLLGCLDRPTEGTYLLNGIDVSRLRDTDLSDIRLKHLGFIFQSFNLIPQLTVEENIALPLYYLGWDAHSSSRRARELAGRVGLADRLHHRPRELSGGQQQRVAIARSLVNDPVLLLADEPTGDLDVDTERDIMEIFSSVNKLGKTIVMVTHNPDLSTYSDRLFRMEKGVIAELPSRRS